jgi:hypothetical protein
MLAFRAVDNADEICHRRVVVAAHHDHAERSVDRGPPD